MITADASFYTGIKTAQVMYTSAAEIHLNFLYREDGIVIGYATITDGGASDYPTQGEAIFELTTTLIDAETGSGSGESAPFYNAAQKAVKTILAALNGGVTFTVT
jgi:hypothetical protein